MFFNAELEDEYRSNDNSTWKRSKKQDREEKLKEVVEDGVGMSYEHKPCIGCTEKGKQITFSNITINMKYIQA